MPLCILKKVGRDACAPRQTSVLFLFVPNKNKGNNKQQRQRGIWSLAYSRLIEMFIDLDLLSC